MCRAAYKPKSLVPFILSILLTVGTYLCFNTPGFAQQEHAVESSARNDLQATPTAPSQAAQPTKATSSESQPASQPKQKKKTSA
jgi:hypothetical protein